MPEIIPEHTVEPVFQGGIELVPRAGIAPSERLRDLAPPDLLHAIRGMEPGTFLFLEEEFTGIADPPATEVQFFLRPELARGREASRHAVQFGQLVFRSESDAGTELVAVKPFDFAKDAAHEYGAVSYVNDLHPNGSRPLGWRLLGFFRGDNNAVSLITAYDDSVKTYDGTFWNPNRTPGDREVRRALGQCAYSLASIHYHLGSHGDAQVKNIGVDRIGIRYIDLESFVRFHADEGGSFREAILEDIGKFLNSLNVVQESTSGEQIVLDRDYTPALAPYFVSPYLRIVQSAQSPLPEAAYVGAAEILSLYNPNPSAN